MDRPEKCREWIGARNRKGYGLTWPKRHGTQLVHRIAYIDAHGPLPPKVCVLHHCDNPPCWRLDHLYAGTPAQNTADMMKRGRHVAPTGERNGRTTIPDALVAEMRSRWTTGATFKEMAREYGVHPVTVSRICRGLRRE